MTPVSGLSLSLGPVDRLSGGEYTCTASNGVGRPAAATVRVIVEGESNIQNFRNLFQASVYVKIRTGIDIAEINAMNQEFRNRKLISKQRLTLVFCWILPAGLLKITILKSQ